MKGYVGGFFCRSTEGRLHIGPLGVFSDDEEVSFTVLRGFGYLFLLSGRGGWTEHIRQRLRLGVRALGCDVQRFDVKDHGFGHVQLESLILAQNERWRQA